MTAGTGIDPETFSDLHAGTDTFVAVDAMTMKVRDERRVATVAAMLATGVNADGYLEVLGSHRDNGIRRPSNPHR